MQYLSDHRKGCTCSFWVSISTQGGSSYLSVLSNTALGVQTLCKILLVEEVSKDCTPVTACVWENTGQGKKNPKLKSETGTSLPHRLTTPLRTLSLWNIQHGSWVQTENCMFSIVTGINSILEINKEKNQTITLLFG